MEGKETEPRYFDCFKTDREADMQIKLVPNPKHKSRPMEVFLRLVDYFRRTATRSKDEGWLVIDRDAWSEAELDEVCTKAKTEGFFVAMSNPCFELWLYLHLRTDRPFNGRHDCQKRLEEILDSYSMDSKGGYDVGALLHGVENAIERAIKLDLNPDHPWPKSQCTRVYRLVAKLLGRDLDQEAKDAADVKKTRNTTNSRRRK